jgi:cytoskeletal protein RodZ
MSSDKKRAFRRDMLIASVLLAAGFGVSIFSVAELKARDTQMAQATQPLQSSPSTPNNAPAESKPGGERPTTPAPEPAHPDARAQKDGATAVLPPAPAEKTAAPIQQR